jgi:hypothetical protein
MKLLKWLFVLAIAVSGCKKDKGSLSVTGQVTNAVTGQPVSGVQVVLKSRDLSGGTYITTPVTAATATTDASGYYTLEWQRRSSSEYILSANKSGYISYSESINPDLFNGTPNQTRNFGMPALAWLRIHIQNVNPFDAADEVTFQLTSGYQSCGASCCNGLPVVIPGMVVDSVYVCQVYGGGTVSWQALATHNGNTQTQQNAAVAVAFDTVQINLNY